MLATNKRISKRALSLLMVDTLIIWASPHLVFIPLFDYAGYNFPRTSLPFNNAFTYLTFFVFISIFYLFGLYNFRQDFRTKLLVLKIMTACTSGSVMIIAVSYFFRINIHSRWAYFYFSIFIVSGILFARYIYSIIGSTETYAKKVIIIGCGDSGKEISRSLKRKEKGWMRLVAFLDTDQNKKGMIIEGVPVVCQEKSLTETVAQLNPDLLIVAMRRNNFSKLIPELIKFIQQGLIVWDAPTAFEILEGRVPLRYVNFQWLLFAVQNGNKAFAWRLKKVMDISFSALIFIMSVPVIILCGIAVFLESGFPVIFTQERIGKNGKIFKLYKIRTMYGTTHKKGDKGTSKINNQITRVGKILRRLHLDELPQLINVLKGDMSLIGPRAEIFDFVYQYIKDKNELKELEVPHANELDSNNKLDDTFSEYIPFVEQRFTVPQGITGWAQIHEPYVSSSYEDMIKKLEYDLYYIKHISLLLDIEIVIKTIRSMLLGKGK